LLAAIERVAPAVYASYGTRVNQPFDSAADLKDAPRIEGAKLRPKDAATLILVRRDGPKTRVLMGRRAEGHVFMASKWVFPGGRIERSDYSAPFATDLKPQTAAVLARSTPPRRARALALTAVRETYEETGLMLARTAPKRPAAGPWREFMARGALADLEALDYVARAITPPGRARRFDARFFIADAERLMHLDPEPGVEKELDELAWIDLHDTADLDLPQITRFVLSEVRERIADPARTPPLVRMVRGRHRVERD
jgi:8-oxo-dGTP pyrophosphatase MutT (NUDIX family)